MTTDKPWVTADGVRVGPDDFVWVVIYGRDGMPYELAHRKVKVHLARSGDCHTFASHYAACRKIAERIDEWKHEVAARTKEYDRFLALVAKAND